MTETECYNCDYSENCEWDLIMANVMTKTSPRCVAKAWHEKSLQVFVEKTEQVRARIVGE
jgi:hypothetical protein